MLVQPSKRLQDKITVCMNGRDSCSFYPKCILYNANSGFKYECVAVTNIIIIQDFISSYMDTIQITVQLPITDYRNIVKNVQDMECVLLLQPADVARHASKLAKPIISKYRVFLTDQFDLDKEINPSQIGNSGKPETSSQALHLVDYSFSLISDDMHDIRQTQLNAILTDVTMTDILHWASQQFGIKYTSIVPSDNTISYPTVIIPPMKDIGTLFPYLHNQYGIYSKGLGYYYTGNTLYIFPAFDVDNETSPIDGVIHIINAPPKTYAGSKCNHNIIDKDIFVLSNTRARLEPLNSIGSENAGTTHILIDDDAILDQMSTINNNGEVNVSSSSLVSVSSQNTRGNTSSTMQNTKFYNSSNLYTSTSTLASYNGVKLTTGWNTAIPYLVKPGHNVTYHYDAGDGRYCIQRGRITRIIYSSETYSNFDPMRPLIAFHAALEVFLEPDVKSENTYQYE